MASSFPLVQYYPAQDFVERMDDMTLDPLASALYGNPEQQQGQHNSHTSQEPFEVIAEYDDQGILWVAFRAVSDYGDSDLTVTVAATPGPDGKAVVEAMERAAELLRLGEPFHEVLTLSSGLYLAFAFSKETSFEVGVEIPSYSQTRLACSLYNEDQREAAAAQLASVAFLLWPMVSSSQTGAWESGDTADHARSTPLSVSSYVTTSGTPDTDASNDNNGGGDTRSPTIMLPFGDMSSSYSSSLSPSGSFWSSPSSSSPGGGGGGGGVFVGRSNSIPPPVAPQSRHPLVQRIEQARLTAQQLAQTKPIITQITRAASSAPRAFTPQQALMQRAMKMFSQPYNQATDTTTPVRQITTTRKTTIETVTNTSLRHHAAQQVSTRPTGRTMRYFGTPLTTHTSRV